MEEDLRSSGAGLRGFKSHPRHHYGKIYSEGLNTHSIVEEKFCSLGKSFFFFLIGSCEKFSMN